MFSVPYIIHTLHALAKCFLVVCLWTVHVSVMLNSTNNCESICLQAATSSLTKRNSAEGSKLSAPGIATQGSADSMQPSIKPEPGSKAEYTSAADTSALPPSVSAGLKQEAAAALPMEVDDDAMFQKKPSRAVKPDSSEVRINVTMTR